MTEQYVTRRDWVTALAKNTDSSFAVGQESQSKTKTASPVELYKGPVRALEGLPLIDNNELKNLQETLRGTGFPFFDKIATDITLLRIPFHHPEMPEWLVNHPLPITRNGSNTSHAWLDFDTDIRSAQQYTFTHKPSGNRGRNAAFDTAYHGLHLGFDAAIESSHPINKALLLGKEHLSNMLTVGMGQQFYDLVTEHGLYEFQTLDGEPITDKTIAQKIGADMYFKSFEGDHNSTNWRTTDVLPIILMGTGIGHIWSEGKMREELPYYNPFVAGAIRFYQNEAVREDIFTLVNDWVEDDTLLPPPYTLELIHQPHIQKEINELHRTIYGL